MVDGARKNSGAPEYMARDTQSIFDIFGSCDRSLLYLSYRARYILFRSGFILSSASGSFSMRDITSRALSGSTQKRDDGDAAIFFTTASPVEYTS